MLHVNVDNEILTTSGCTGVIKMVNLKSCRARLYIDFEILGGTPVFNGTRVPIKNLFDYLETGETIEIFLQDFDSVSH